MNSLFLLQDDLKTAEKSINNVMLLVAELRRSRNVGNVVSIR